MIYLFEDFYLDADDYCYMLIKKGKRPKQDFKTRKIIDGEYTEYRTCLGYYNNVKNALQALLQYKVRTFIKGSEMPCESRNFALLIDYIEAIEKKIENIKFE